jgi:4-amino-4-deoxy-L-arabinose transferase-like glycosyltransferase
VKLPELTIQNPSSTPPSSSLPSSATRPWHRWALGAILVLSAFLNFYRLNQTGYNNSYYAAGVKSMTMSWHNFFFVSFDPGGFVTIDKPPLGFWMQAASAKLFGFSGWSILFPEALAGVLAVAVLYILVRRSFGPIAGLIAALVLAVTPVSVATQRNNTIDSLLVFTLLLSAWAMIRAMETRRLRWLLLCALGIGLGFNIKMMEAYLVVPAFGLVYLLGSSHNWVKRTLHLALALVLMLVVSFSWIVAVDLTPTSQRPYVGSTQDNSELSLALGYNGVQRLLGMSFGRGGNRPARNEQNAARPQTTPQATAQSTPAQQNANQPGTPPQQGGQQPPNNGGPGGGMFGTGQAGPLRLFTESDLSGQIAWMLALAFIGLVVACWQERVRLPLSKQQQALVLWGLWLLTTYGFFSVAGFFHPYYLITMGPPIAALVGIGLVTLWKEYQHSGWRGWLLPLALLATAAVQVYLLLGYSTQSNILTPIVLTLSALVAVILGIARLFEGIRVPSLVRTATTIGLLAVLIAPTTWAALTIMGGGQDLPSAGPSRGGMFGGGPGGNGQRAFERANGRYGTANRQGNAQQGTPSANGAPPNIGGGGPSNSNNNKLQEYLLANQGSTRFLVAVPSSQMADSLILNTGKPVMALGGFTGSDPILDTQKVATLVSNGTVRFFLLSGGRSNQQSAQSGNNGNNTNKQAAQSGNHTHQQAGGPGGQQSSVTSWVTNHCSTVPSDQWQSTQSQNQDGQSFGGGFGGGSQQLYDCSKQA